MQRRLLLSCVFFLFCLSAFTQNQFEYGLKAGLRAGQVDLVTDFEFFGIAAERVFDGVIYARPQLGIWWSIPLYRRWSLRPELSWVPKQWSDADVAPDQRNPVEFTYFTLPVAFVYRNGNWSLSVGPELSLLLDQRLQRPDRLRGRIEHHNIDEQVLEVGLNAGIEYYTGRIVVGLRADRDLTAFMESRFAFGNGDQIYLRRYHQGAALWIGYRL